VKPKRYRQEFRTRFCEGLLTRRILIAEGATEASAFPAVCQQLAELNPETYSSLEALGICTIDAGGQSNIPQMAKFYGDLGKRIFTICDKQTAEQKAVIEAQVDVLLMHDEKGFENLVFKNTTEDALKRFIALIEWPAHLASKYPNPETTAQEALGEYFAWSKGNWGIADFLTQCTEDEIPEWLREACAALKTDCSPSLAGDESWLDTTGPTSGAIAG
jgi:putative ATP-dependent endonuclease of the OLD family